MTAWVRCIWEAEYLAERGVPFEVIPGVSSAIAAPLHASIAARLMEHGRDPVTPAALIEMAYWPSERVHVATLAAIALEAARANAQPPYTLVIGEVVRLREKLRPGKAPIARPDK